MVIHTADELLDIVDKNDQVIGQKRRSEVYEKQLSNFRVINAVIVNSEGKLWISRRTAYKRVFPLALDMSAAGHVESGETYEQAFARELQEELNLTLDQVNYKLVGYFTPHEHGVSAFMKVYEMQINEVPDYNKNDFIEYFWLSPNELLQKIAIGEPAKGDLPKIVKLLYTHAIQL